MILQICKNSYHLFVISIKNLGYFRYKFFSKKDWHKILRQSPVCHVSRLSC